MVTVWSQSHNKEFEITRFWKSYLYKKRAGLWIQRLEVRRSLTHPSFFPLLPHDGLKMPQKQLKRTRLWLTDGSCIWCRIVVYRTRKPLVEWLIGVIHRQAQGRAAEWGDL